LGDRDDDDDDDNDDDEMMMKRRENFFDQSLSRLLSRVNVQPAA